MGLLALDAIQPGMILANDVKDRNGRVLLSKGAEITDKHLRIFKMWGIHTVDVQGDGREEPPSMPPSEVDPEILQRSEKRVAELFCHNDLSHPFIKELFRLVTLEHLSGMGDLSRGS